MQVSFSTTVSLFSFVLTSRLSFCFEFDFTPNRKKTGKVKMGLRLPHFQVAQVSFVAKIYGKFPLCATIG